MNSIHYEVDISNDKAEHFEKIVSVKLLVIVIIYFKLVPCLTPTDRPNKDASYQLLLVL